jgi:soluble lytic murein transglycosylase-like protein
MTTNAIISLILALAPVYHINPYVALSVAYTESNLNPKAIGTKKEVGLFQIMPAMYEQYGYTKKDMEDPLHNIQLGLTMLSDAKNNCKHKSDLTFLVCYNAGLRVGNKIKNPQQFSYVKKIEKHLITILSTEKE